MGKIGHTEELSHFHARPISGILPIMYCKVFT